jgi:N-acetylglutamate synthase-like GNAT family acetyltransferase
MNYDIRQARMEDLNQCLELMNHPNLLYANEIAPEADYVGGFIDGKHFLVAEINNKIVGLCAGEPIKSNGFLMHYLIANPNYSKYKIGDSLLRTMTNFLTESGTEFILAYANAADTRLINLYKRKYNCWIGKPHCEIVKILI